MLRSAISIPCLLALTSALAGLAHAGDVRVTAVGSVTAITGGTPPAPFAGAAVGDTFELIVETAGAPFMVSASEWEYDTDPFAGEVRIGASMLPLRPEESGTVRLANRTIDSVVVGASPAEPFVGGVGVILVDFSGSFLSSPDIQQVVGQTMTGSIPGQAVLISATSPAQIEAEILTLRFDVGDCPVIGSNECTATINSRGFAAAMTACGSLTVADNDVVLGAYGLPINTFGFFLNSQTTGFVSQPGGSAGNLCLGGSIGRFVGPGQIRASGALGAISLDIDISQLPGPLGPIPAQPGATWYFTAWYRDVNSLGTSNFADRLALTFQ